MTEGASSSDDVDRDGGGGGRTKLTGGSTPIVGLAGRFEF